MNLPECDSLDSLLLPRQQPDNAHFQARLENAKEQESKTMKNLIIQKAEEAPLCLQLHSNLASLCAASLWLSLKTIRFLFT
jgi:hypothetical protein